MEYITLGIRGCDRIYNQAWCFNLGFILCPWYHSDNLGPLCVLKREGPTTLKSVRWKDQICIWSKQAQQNRDDRGSNNDVVSYTYCKIKGESHVRGIVKIIMHMWIDTIERKWLVYKISGLLHLFMTNWF